MKQEQSKLFTMRMTKKEYKKLRSNAEKAGYVTISSYIREKLIEGK